MIYPEPLFGTNRDALTGPRVADMLETSAAEPASEPRYPEKYLVRRGI
jgi:hypothetical protein